MKSPQQLYADFTALLDGQITRMCSSSGEFSGKLNLNKAERLAFLATVQREAYAQGFAEAREAAYYASVDASTVSDAMRDIKALTPKETP